MSQPTIALISAVAASIPPTRAAFDTGFPDARLWNLLDDRLLEDATEQGGLTPSLSARMTRLIDHATTEGADGILLTCSLYAPVAHEASRHSDIPILAPDDAVFAAAQRPDYRRVLVISSGRDPLDDSVARLSEVVGSGTRVEGAVAFAAAPAARAGDHSALVDAVSAAVQEAGAGYDAVVLGQFSLAPSAGDVSVRVGLPVLAGPTFAVDLLRRQISGARS